MLEREIQSFLEQLRTRREFLKISGKGISTMAVTATVLNLLGCGNNQSGNQATPTATVTVTPKGILIAQRNRCVGCLKCETICSIKNNGKSSPYISRVKVARNYHYGLTMAADYNKGEGDYGNFLMTQETCRQCKDPQCMAQCPVKAIAYSETTGTWTVDEEKCIGCGTCTKACPWHMPTVDPETEKSSKCILCGACAEHCPAGALQIMPWKEVTVMLKKKGYSIA
ncbi:putative ferredoxin-like protein YdhY [Oxobacter pfennigii]|uniref:Putative ferredoxin-like protein YdhY n=1 Tax=Oxobacter pfennigii TaxID=36849 RepID=A0A0N8NTZ0_9CLOT|nr:ferredoxin-like protein [Oxobacter pfennigii]KPU46168.1 putative ferredoxin-like protein YdhY [Oxobacter pfennigii]